MPRITIRLDPSQNEFVNSLCNITGARRYSVVKYVFQTGVLCIGLLAEIRKDLLKMLGEVHSKANKEQAISSLKNIWRNENGKEKQK